MATVSTATYLATVPTFTEGWASTEPPETAEFLQRHDGVGGAVVFGKGAVLFGVIDDSPQAIQRVFPKDKSPVSVSFMDPTGMFKDGYPFVSMLGSGLGNMMPRRGLGSGNRQAIRGSSCRP